MKKSKLPPQSTSRFLVTVRHATEHTPKELELALSVTMGMGIVSNPTLVPQFGELDIGDYKHVDSMTDFDRDSVEALSKAQRELLRTLNGFQPVYRWPGESARRTAVVLAKRGLLEKKADGYMLYRVTPEGQKLVELILLYDTIKLTNEPTDS